MYTPAGRTVRNPLLEDVLRPSRAGLGSNWPHGLRRMNNCTGDFRLYESGCLSAQSSLDDLAGSPYVICVKYNSGNVCLSNSRRQFSKSHPVIY